MSGVDESAAGGCSVRRPVPMPVPLTDATSADADVIPTAENIFDRPLASAPWLPSRPVLDLALTAIPVVTDDLAASIIVQMAETIVDLREELQSVRSVQAMALGLLHQRHAEVIRLKSRLSAQRDEARSS